MLKKPRRRENRAVGADLMAREWPTKLLLKGRGRGFLFIFFFLSNPRD